MKKIKFTLVILALMIFVSNTNRVKAQDIYKTNADTIRLTNEFYLLAKTDGNTIYYTLDISQFHTEFENLYFKDFISNDNKITFKTISFKEGQEAIFAVDKKYTSKEVLYFFGTAKKMTKTENYRFSDIEKQSFISKAKKQ